MSQEPTDRESLLLDLHLARLTDEQRQWVESELNRDEKFRAKSNQLRHVLEPLDHWHLATTSSNVADRVLAFVQEAQSSEVKPSSGKWATEGLRTLTFPRFREVVAIAACLVLLIGAIVPGVGELRSRAQQATCASHLGSIFRGLGAYQSTFESHLPFTPGPTNAAWLPNGPNAAGYASNSRHPFLLIKLRLGPRPEDFVCPSDRIAIPMPWGNVSACGDFEKSSNVSFDSLSLAGPAPNVKPATPIAYLADRNPLFVGARFNATVDPDTTNSPAHRRRGQSVLYTSGHVEFARSPIVGARRDNLWLIRNVRYYRGTEAPTTPDDAFLVPGYPTTDPLVSRPESR